MLTVNVTQVAKCSDLPTSTELTSTSASRKFLHVETTNIDDARLWAFCIGARNLFAAVGTIIGLVVMWSGNGPTGVVIVLTASWYMLLSAVAMGAADLLGFWKPRGGSLTGVLGSGIPPLVVLIAAAF